MKKLHKVLMGLTAIVMAFSMTAMTACVDGEGGGNQGGTNQGGTQQGGNEGGNQGGNQQGGNEGGNQGGNQQGGNEGGNQGGNTTVTKTDAQKTIEAFQKQSFKAISLELNSESNDDSKYFNCDADGKILADATEYVNKYNSVSTTKEKINLYNFAMDMSNSSISVPLGEDGKPDEEHKYESYNYSFTRGDYDFYTYSNKEITDFSKVALEASKGETSEQFEAILAQMPEEGVPAGIMAPVTAVLNLADIYGGATFADKKLTVNFNKVAYKMYNEVLKVIEDLNDDTTVGDVIAATPVKNLIESLTYGIDAKEVYDGLYSYAVESEMVTKAQLDAILVSVPKPEEGESVYAYLVKLLESKEVATLLGGVVSEMGITLPEDTAIADMTVSEVITMVMGMIGGGSQGAPSTGAKPMAQAAASSAPSMDDIKEMVKGVLDQYVTVTEDKVTVTIDKDNTTEVSAVELVFAVGDDYTVTSVSFSADVVSTYDDVRQIGSSSSANGEVTKYYERNVGKTTESVSATIVLSATEYTLTDISKANVEKSSYVMVDGTYYSEGRILTVYQIDEMMGKKLQTQVYFGVTMKDGEITDVAAYTNEYDEENNKTVKNLIEDCVWDGEETLTFAINGKVIYKVEIRVEEHNGQVDYIQIMCRPYEVVPAEGYDLMPNSSRVYIQPERVVTTSTVEEILAQAK